MFGRGLKSRFFKQDRESHRNITLILRNILLVFEFLINSHSKLMEETIYSICRFCQILFSSSTTTITTKLETLAETK